MESVEPLDVYSDNSARYRYRVPVSVLRELQYEGLRSSSQFEVGGWLWRFHLQERHVDGERYLSLHLQSCSPGCVPVHFKLTVMCYRDPLQSKSKAFHCTFRRPGSAWGLNQFIPMAQLLDPRSGYVYTVEETGTRCVDFEVTLQVENDTAALPRGTGALLGPPQEKDAHRGGYTLSPRGGAAAHNSPPQRGRNPSPSHLVRSERSVDRRSMSMAGRGDGGGGGGGGGGGAAGMDNGPRDRRMLGGVLTPPPPPGPASTALTLRERSNLSSMSRTAGGGVVAAAGASYARDHNPQRTGAALAYPFEHLETLCDMTFDVQGVRVKAHRCVIGARMRPLLPEQMLPLQVGCIVSIAVPLDVFTTFLRYVYTEEFPERGTLPPESLLDLYLLAAACEFYDLGSICIDYVRPLLTVENILPIVLTRYNAADDVLNALYLNVILENYEALIEDKQFEEIPGHLNRRLLLILYQHESVVTAPIPAMKNTLGKQLTWLAETGEYSDYDWPVGPQKYVVHAHRFILASRSVAFSQALNPRSPGPVPACAGPDLDFSLRSWQKLLTGMYRRHLDVNRDFSAEDVAIAFKMQTVLGMDGHLKKEAEEAFSSSNALRLLIYAVKHQIPELHERAINYVAANFRAMIRDDPQAWELISELPQSAVVSLFRTVTEHSL